MLNRTPFAVLGMVFALAVGLPGQAEAQVLPPTPEQEVRPTRPPGAPSRPERGTRMSRRPASTPAPPPVEQIISEAQALATSAGLACQVTTAIQPAVTAERIKMYEAACATGPGYILIATTPPQSFDCLELTGTAATARLRDPAADVGQQCSLPANQNGLAVIGGWAREAGVTCTVDEAIAVGRSDAGAIVYEIGCSGADGYWLEKAGEGWKLQECMQIASMGGTCRFTTTQEQIDGFKSKLVGTDAAACDVTQVRLMGWNDAGRFYEAKCAAEGEGYIARIDSAGVTQQIYPCATAQRIGNGCTLTPAPAAAPAPTE